MKGPEVEAAGRDEARDAPHDEDQDLAARLRAAAAKIDPRTLAERAAELRTSRETEEWQAAQEAAREQELVRQREREREIEAEKIAERDRDRGWGYDL